MVNVLLISTYELGRQPFGLASPAAWLREAGARVTCVDLTRELLPDGVATTADLIAWHLPMHTATRLAVPLIVRMRVRNPSAHLCCYGLYASLNAPHLRSLGVQTVLGGEFEADLLALAARLDGRAGSTGAAVGVPRLRFRVPDRSGLPSLSRYAALRTADGASRVVGYTEASRGCKHFCRHCPIVPVYEGRFRIVPHDVVLDDVRAQVESGARHITFGDPDFFNGIRHAIGLVEHLALELPGITYDVTIKVEHLLTHRVWLSTLRDTGCVFVTSAVESLDDHVLRLLEKGHTRADFEQAVHACRAAGLALAPTFVAFTPWTTLDGYCTLLRTIDALALVDAVAPIQLAIRLLIPEASRLLAVPDVRSRVGPFDPAALAYPWTHPDARVDDLQAAVMDRVRRQPSAPRRDVFAAVCRIAHERAGVPQPVIDATPARSRASVPYLNEPWYC